MLRKLKGYSQEYVANAVGISRQAYAKWESGATVPDLIKAERLAHLYGVAIDALMKTESMENVGVIPPAPKGKNIWGSVILGDRGQIVIPKAARDKLELRSGERLVVLSDELGLALIPAEHFEKMMLDLMDMVSKEL